MLLVRTKYGQVNQDKLLIFTNNSSKQFLEKMSENRFRQRYVYPGRNALPVR